MSTEKLASTIENFKEATIKCTDYCFGKIEKRPNPLSIAEISEIKLSPELGFFYQNYDCCDLMIENISIVAWNDLLHRQSDFTTYSKDNGKTYIPDPNWTDGWIVFADLNDDPIVANTNSKKTPILAAIEGNDYIEIAPSLNVFFQILTKLIISSQFHKENEPNADKNFEEWISYKKEILQPYILQQLSEILDEEHLQNIKTFLYS